MTAKNGRGFGAQVVIVLGGLAALATVHAIVLVPSLMGQAASQSAEMIRQSLDQHEARPHNDAVTTREMGLLLERFIQMERALGKRLDTANMRLIAIEQKIKGK